MLLLKNNTIVVLRGMLIFLFLAVVLIPFIEAIIWSEPAEVPFNVTSGNLTINILSPENKTYNYNNIPVNATTNKDAICWFFLDNIFQGYLNKFNNTYFVGSTNANNGTHLFVINCRDIFSNTNAENVSFSVAVLIPQPSPIPSPSPSPQVKKVVIREKQVFSDKQTCTEWECVGNKMVRYCDYGVDPIEIGGECGRNIIDDKKDEIKVKGNGLWLWLFWIILILVIIALVAIVLTTILKK